MSFADRVALITGAGSGIGRQLALNLAREGAKVGGIDLTASPLESLAQEIKATPFAYETADVTDRDALNGAVARLEQRLGPTDLLIASAGIGRGTSVEKYDAAEVDLVIRVNLIGLSNSFGAVLPGMRQRKAGHLVALSSLASYHGMPRMAAYCASKAGVSALCDSLRVELRPCGIAVTTICPGFIHTPMTADLKMKKPPPMLALDDAANRMMKAIRRRQSYIAFPASGVWLLRMFKYTPTWFGDWLARGYLKKLPAE